jgi:Tfp pilus assembly protein PilO
VSSFWSKRSSREKLIFCLCILVAAVFVAVEGVVRPYEAFLESRQAVLDAKEIRAAKYERWAAMSGARSGLAETVARVRAQGGQEEEMSRFLKAVEALARDASIRVTDLKPLPVEDKGTYQEYQVDVQTEAALEAQLRFLYRVQASPLLLAVPRFSLASSHGTAGDSKLRLSLTIARLLLPAEGGAAPSREKTAEGAP